MDFALRRTYRTQLTKIVNSAEEYLTFDQVEAVELSVLIARVKAISTSLNDVDQRLSSTFNEDQMEEECQKIVEYNDKAVEIVARLEQRLHVVKQPNEAQPETRREHLPLLSNNEQNGHGSFIPISTSSKLQVRLPKLELMKFNGNTDEWPAFWEQYSSAIHDNNDLDDSAKFMYLRTLLIGQAALTISGLTSRSASYQDAIDLIKSEYGNTERIVESYIQKLLTISPVKYDRDIQSLRKLYNTASTITRSLLTLGVSADQYGLMVKSLIFKALQYNLRVQFNKMKTKNCIDATFSVGSEIANDGVIDYNKQIRALIQFIKIEVDSLEQSYIGENSESKDFNRVSYNVPKRKNETCTAAGLFTNVRECCLFCKAKTHITKDCNADMGLAEKKNILKQNNRCFRCTLSNHNSKFSKTKDIRCTKCNSRHVTTMCDPNYSRRPSNVESISTSTKSTNYDTKPSPNGNDTTNLFTNGRIDNAYLQTACAFIPNSSCNNAFIRLVLDGGSQLSFIKEDVSRQLNLSVIGTHKVSILPFGSTVRSPARLCNRVQVPLRSQFNEDIILINAVEVPEICFDSLIPPSLKEPVINNFALTNHLADTNADLCLTHKGITILVGADNYWKIVTGEIQRLSENLTAVNSKFGWTLHGISDSNLSWDFAVNFNVVDVFNTQVSCDTSNLSFDIKKFWDLETIGVVSNEKSDCITDKINEHIQFNNDRYEVSLPWETEDKNLDNNYTGALAHVKNLTFKLCKYGRLNEYDCAIREYLQNDCAEIVVNDVASDCVYYMPHRPVYREDKETTKLRDVFNASAHAPGFPSLNEKLMTGDNLVPDLLAILMNSRLGSVAMIADIEKAFLQISLDKQDRDTHRFLWYKEPIGKRITSISELPPLKTYRMKRVTFGVTSSPFLLAVTIRKHLLEQPSERRKIADILLNSFYVDDLVVALKSTEEALELYELSRQMMTSANMNLRKWYSNDPNMLKRFSEDCQKSSVSENKKVLGIYWHTVTDEVSIDVSSIINESIHQLSTKRNVLQTMAKIFDPFGILGPFTVRAKILLQNIWKLQVEWDIILPKDFDNEWQLWCSEVSTLADLTLPRCLLKSNSDEVELHVFADASLHAYGAVAYLKCLSSNEHQFIMSKNRITPINQNGDKTLTLPKLELTVALCAARLQKYILENLPLNVKDVFLWSDSKISLYWIKGKSKNWKPYVKNRVNEINRVLEIGDTAREKKIPLIC